MKETLERYAELKAVIAEAEEEMDSLKEVIKEGMEVDQVYDIGTAKITLSKGKAKWTYSAPTQAAEEELKAKKKEEEQLGIAVATHGEPFITCKLVVK